MFNENCNALFPHTGDAGDLTKILIATGTVCMDIEAGVLSDNRSSGWLALKLVIVPLVEEGSNFKCKF